MRRFKKIRNLISGFLFVLCIFAFAQNKIKVAAIGNSVTFGYLLKDPATESYPVQLQKMLGDKYEVRNFGHSGATLLREGHNPYNKTKEYQEALDFKPDIAVIALGLNDTDPRDWPDYSLFFQRDYSELISDIRKSNPKVKIYICQLTPIFSGHPRFLSGTRDWFGQIQTLIPQIAKANDVGLIDLFTPLKRRIDLFNDFLHPNKQGAGILAHTVALVIAKDPQPLQLNRTLTSNMVLQRSTENPLFGTGTPGAKVTVDFYGQKYSTNVASTGKWELLLPQMQAGGPYRIVVSSGKEKIKLENILFGDVYLASGQSNMAYPVSATLNKDELLRGIGKHGIIRIYNAHNLTDTNAVVWDTLTLREVNDLHFFSGSWEIPNQQNVADFSAVAYSFANELSKNVDVPIGIIDLSVGGSTTESWIKRKDLEDDNLLATYIVNWRTSDFMMPWVRERANLNLKLATVKNQRHPYQPAYNYEAGLTHWKNTKLEAVLWYQGESNAHNVDLHEHLFKVLVKSWRQNFNQKLPFYFVQLPNMERPSWGKFRASQTSLEKEVPNTHMAVTLGLGDSLNVHYPNKIPVGKRLAYLVEQFEYGKKIHGEHPTLSNFKRYGSHLTLHFNDADQLKTLNESVVKGFQWMDDKGYLHPAEATIQGATDVVLKLPDMPVQKLLYGYQPFTHANLCNEMSVPVPTFSIELKTENAL